MFRVRERVKKMRFIFNIEKSLSRERVETSRATMAQNMHKNFYFCNTEIRHTACKQLHVNSSIFFFLLLLLLFVFVSFSPLSCRNDNGDDRFLSHYIIMFVVFFFLSYFCWLWLLSVWFRCFFFHFVFPNVFLCLSVNARFEAFISFSSPSLMEPLVLYCAYNCVSVFVQTAGNILKVNSNTCTPFTRTQLHEHEYTYTPN